MRILRKISERFLKLSWNSKQKNKINKNSNFLDLNIKMQNSPFQTKLYDKQGNFSFNVIRMSYKSSNFPHKILYSAMSAKILRICKAITSSQDFIKSATILI